MVCGISLVFRGAFLLKYCFLYIEIGSLQKKVGVSFQKDEVFAPSTLRFSGNKTPFSVLKYGVLFFSNALSIFRKGGSIFCIFTNSQTKQELCGRNYCYCPWELVSDFGEHKWLFCLKFSQ